MTRDSLHKALRARIELLRFACFDGYAVADRTPY